ncbi:MAG: glycosyltransferase [Acidobacteria bacterium]|nr:glycosyltransferase [Acidobacteriota bacterium]
MKEQLKEKLSPETKLLLRRWLVGSFELAVRAAAACYRAARRVVDRAVAQGLDLERAWDVPPRPQAPRDEPWGARDFLFLSDTLEGRRGAPRPDSQVRTSVIIPVFNRVEFTFQCLRSLLREVDFDETEVIVVNNASTDETPAVLARLRDFVRVVDNEENSGFADACDQGAAHARGRHLVFLSNDTVVLPGWLDALVETVERDESVGAVGSMLLRPDGRVREAGAITWGDGSTSAYGGGGAAGDRRYSFAREVDGCSVASLLVRRDLFVRLGGFDTRFAHAAHQSADLCLGARSLGYKVVYQPLSRVAQHDEGEGGRRRGAADRDEFYAKWREVLAREQLPPGAGDAERAANRRWATQVAVFDELTPTPDRDAGSARMMFILRALSEWCHPVFVTTGKRSWHEYEKLLWREGIETASAVDYRRLIARRNFRAVVLSRPAVAAMLLAPIRRAAPGLKIVYDMLDVHHLRATREAALTGDARAEREAEALRLLETRLARAADLVWCGSHPDQELMARLAPGVPSVVVPTVHELHGRGLAFDGREHLLFVGNFSHRPNTDAVHFLAREVMPLVRRALPGVELLVVGGNAPPEFEGYASAGVRLLGYVPDLDLIMSGCRVFVAPIRFGSGVNGKIGEALSYGLPVVTTTIGAEGWGFTEGEQILTADAPADFAEAVLRLYNDAALWQRLSDGGYRHVAERSTPEVVGRIVNDSLRDGAAAPRREFPRRDATEP